MTQTTAFAHELVETLRERRQGGVARSLEWRRTQLDGIVRMLLQNTSLWEAALAEDLGKSELETHVTEIGQVVAEARHASRRVRSWARPKQVATPWSLWPATAKTIAEPLGVVLIIAPWNYPLQLCLSPLIGALVAGNSAVVKPSELAPATSRLLAELVPAYLDERAVRVVEGGADATTALLEARFDLIFYTGGGRVGRIVAEAAAKHLTPTILELGGKSPVYVDASCDLEVTARRIAWAKGMNAGQTCVAPDYVLADRRIAPALVDAIGRAFVEMYGEDAAASPDFGRIVNERHVERLTGYLGSGEITTGGEVDLGNRFVAPTVVVEPAADSPVMQEEIFGPILPILAVDGVDDAIDRINDGEKPLALYVYARDRGVVDRILERTSSGGVGVNISNAHLAVPGLPFGGVGESGMGAYHGKHSFEAFSHKKGVLSKPTWADTTALVRPPFTPEMRDFARRFLTRS